VLDKGLLLCTEEDMCISFRLFVKYHQLLFFTSEHYLRHDTFESQHTAEPVISDKEHSDLFLAKNIHILVIDSKCQEDGLT
jgi:hypothetical protein